jgi:methylated-DNA-[protein]-cysteine S-methyltransferase
MGPSFFKYPSPVGILDITFTSRGIIRIGFGKREENKDKQKIDDQDYSIYCHIYNQLNEYFTGKRREFALPLVLEGTGFQKRVWQELKKIPFGETRSYGTIARAIGNPGAARAVGMANNRNPIPIIIPCHRVIGANGDLTGYGGGLNIKRWLLNHELKHRKDD